MGVNQLHRLSRVLEPLAAPATRQASAVRLCSMALGTWAMFQMVLGVAWDVAWHGVIGRDTFWIPPHLVIYSSVTLCGAASLTALLIERIAGRTLTGGFVLSASGVVTMLAAAPFDDWWHARFGKDTTIWSPPHLLGVLGATLIIVGLVLALACELQRRPHLGRAWLLLPLALLLPATTFPLAPARGQPELYTLLASALVPWTLVLGNRLVGRPGTMAAMTAIFLALSRIQDEFVPLAFFATFPGLRGMFGRGGLNIRPGTSLFPPLLLVPALVLELCLLLPAVMDRRRKRAWSWTVTAVAGGAFPALFYLTEAARYTTATGRTWVPLSGPWLAASMGASILSAVAGYLLASRVVLRRAA
jgi:hypothetical protein